MTKENTVELLMSICIAYPTYKPANKELTVGLWFDMLQDYESNEVFAAFKYLVATRDSSFAPSIGEIIGAINNLRDKASNENQMSEQEAWRLVRKCTSGNMEFAKLPEDVQKAVGSEKQIREWGLTENANWEVIQSNFFRSYRQIIERKKEDARIPSSIKKVIQIALNDTKQIGVKNG